MLGSVLQKFRENCSSRITAWHVFPARGARVSGWPEGLNPRLRKAATRLGITELWSHQAQAIYATLAGKNTIVVTPTASGKTLCYNLPALDYLLDDPAARALYLFPAKALAQDQLAELERWGEALEEDFKAATYDGDTPSSVRPRIRTDSRIVITNPDMLHMGILPHHTQWMELFHNLRLVVIDEIHTYRGVFGSHVANVLRRLRRVSAFYRSSPLFICCSATIANPQELAEGIVEGPVEVIGDDGSPKSERHFIFYNPPLIDKELGLRRSAILEVRQLARHFLAAGVSTIIFTQARQTTEILLKYLKEDSAPLSSFSERGALRHENSCGADHCSVRGYRGGYRPLERRAIEQGLRDGTIRAVVSTNALELGIDIGQLDACLMAGYPGSIAATWQRAGRAGRRGETCAAVLVAGNSPLDQYIATHPGYFWEGSPEHARLNPDNLLILLEHLLCAAFELPFHKGESFGTGEGRADFIAELLDYLAERGRLHCVDNRYYWMAEHYPAEEVNLRSVSSNNIVITDMSDADVPKTLGTVERSAAPLLVHEGAIYLHDGATFHVDRLDWDAGQAYVRSISADYYTRASYQVEVSVVEIAAQKSAGNAVLYHGEIEVTGRASGFRKVRFYTCETLGWGDIDLPEQVSMTTGYWFTLEEAAVDKLRKAGWWGYEPTGYRGRDWQKERDKARARDGYRCRLCHAPEKGDREHDVHHLRAFRDFSYLGEGFERKANELDNLITLCRACHRQAENAAHFQGALTGMGHILGHVACLFLMCDMRDIGILSRARSKDTHKPTVTIYEKTPAGVGFSEALFHLHDKLLTTAIEVIRGCECERGCPSCVGPTDEADNAKDYTLAILRELVP